MPSLQAKMRPGLAPTVAERIDAADMLMHRPIRAVGLGAAGCLDLLCQFKAYHRKQINCGGLVHFDGNDQSIFDHAAKFTEVLFWHLNTSGAKDMKDEKGGPASNVINLIRKQSEPTALTSAMVLQGLELVKVFLTIASADRRKQIVEFAKQLATEDTNRKS
jgi:hypothetical protein